MVCDLYDALNLFNLEVCQWLNLVEHIEHLNCLGGHSVAVFL